MQNFFAFFVPFGVALNLNQIFVFLENKVNNFLLQVLRNYMFFFILQSYITNTEYFIVEGFFLKIQFAFNNHKIPILYNRKRCLIKIMNRSLIAKIYTKYK